MNLMKKIVLPRAGILCTVLTLSACGGSDVFNNESTRDALSATAELQTIADRAEAQPIVIATPRGLLSNYSPSAAAASGADPIISSGTIDLPYYFDPSESTTSFWLPSLEVRDTLTVPVIMTMPQGTPPTSEGWPIVIYQHGITRNRTDILAYAGGLAKAGFAVIAIDLPAHGVPKEVLYTTPQGSFYVPNPLVGFHADNTAAADTEQTFGVDNFTHTGTFDEDGDEIDNEIPDGKDDNPGKHFINLSSLLTSRDNLRQGAANLLTLRKSLADIPNIDESKVGLIAHSLGGMVAIPYLAAEAAETPSSIVMAGATITTVLSESGSFSGVIKKGLNLKGITDLDAFYANAQLVVDAGEPANYAAMAADKHPIHLIEVIDDQTVPNSSTENLADIMNAASISSTSPIVAGSPGIVRFTVGSHSSPLRPDAATAGIQTQLANFQGYALSPLGPTIVIDASNCSIIEDAVCSTTAQ